ncbi:MAG: SAM hydroxide adenosyltransferase [Patescibacteria group bacterium]
MKKLIVIGDLFSDTLTCQEIKSAVEGFLKDPTNIDISFVTSAPSTVHTGFLVSQIVQTEEGLGRPLETVIFHNTDPRIHTKDSTVKAEGALPLIVKLKSGIFITGPNAGYSYSMIKDKIDVAYEYKGLNVHGQFHSRDLYSRISAHLMDYLEDEMELDEVGPDKVPDLKGHYVGHIDNFGNLKTTITHQEFKGKYEYGDFVTVKINGVTKKAKYVSNLFGGVPGELVIYPGSSGKQDDRFLEITVWRHFTEAKPTTGIDEFNTPRAGAEVEILR